MELRISKTVFSHASVLMLSVHTDVVLRRVLSVRYSGLAERLVIAGDQISGLLAKNLYGFTAGPH